MARTTRKSATKRSGGITLFGVLVGLILGLAAAVAVALFVTQVPMPFADKASRDPSKVLLPDVRDAPDPNLGLFGSAGTAPRGPTDTRIQPPAPGTPSAPAEGSLDQLIANLTKTAPEPAAVPGTEAPGARAPSATAPAAATAQSGTRPAADTQTTYALQAGAFRSQADAQAMQARILLLGLPVTIQQTVVNGEALHRVRVGPFKGIDEMNRSRARLGQEKIESTVVRP